MEHGAEAELQLTRAVALEEEDPSDAREHVILIGCDLRSIPDPLRDGVRKALANTLPEVEPRCIILNAT